MRFTAWAALGAVLLLLGTWLTRDRWLNPWLAKRTELELRERFQAEVSIGLLETDFWSSLELQDVELRDAGSLPVVRMVELRSLKARFSLLEILQEPLDGLHEVSLDLPQLSLDLPASKAAPEEPVEPIETRVAWLDRLPKLQIEVGQMDLQQQGQPLLKLKQFSTQVGERQTGEVRHRIDATAQALELSVPLASTEAEAPADLKGPVELKGALALEAEWLASGVRVRDLTWGALLALEQLEYDSAGEARLELSAARVALGESHVTVTQAALPLANAGADGGSWKERSFELQLELRLDSAELAQQLGLASAKDPAAAAVWEAAENALAEHTFSGGLVGTAQLSGTLDAPVGEAQLDLQQMNWDGWDLGSGALELHADGERLSIDQLSLRSSLGELGGQGGLQWANFEAQDLQLNGRLDLASLGQVLASKGAAAESPAEPQVEGQTEAESGLASTKESAGSVQLDVQLQGALGAPVVAAMISGEDLRWQGQLLGDLQLEARGRPANEQSGGQALEEGPFGQASWSCSIDPFQLQHPEAKLQASLQCLQLEHGWGLQVAALDLMREERNLALQAPLWVQLGAKGLVLSPLELKGSAGRASWVGSVDASEASSGSAMASPLSGSLTFEDFEPLALLGPLAPLQARLDRLQGSATWNFEELEAAQWSIELTAEHLDWRNLATLQAEGLEQDPGWQLSLKSSSQAGQIAVEDLELAHPELGRLTGQLGFPQQLLEDLAQGHEGVRTADVELHLEALDWDPWAWLQRIRSPEQTDLQQGFALPGSSAFVQVGALQASYDLSGSFPNGLSSQLHLDLEELAIAGKQRSSLGGLANAELTDSSGAQSTRLGCGPAPVRLDLDWNTEAAKLTYSYPAEQLDLQGELRLQAGLQPLEWSTEAGRTALLASLLEGEAQVELQDLRWLARLFAPDLRLSGAAHLDLDLAGSVNDPQPKGRVSIEQAALTIPGSPFPGLRELGLQLDLDPELVMVEGAGEIGGAGFALTGSYALPKLSGASVDAPEAGSGNPDYGVPDLHLVADELLLLRQKGAKLRSRVDLHLVQTESGDPWKLHGELGLRDGVFTAQLDPLALLQPKPAGLSGAPSAGFSLSDSEPLSSMLLDIALVSDEPFRIKNNVLQGSLRPDLRLAGTGRRPYLEGPVYLDPTRVALPSGRVELESGTLIFREEDLGVPQLAIQGEAKMAGYLISILVEGEADQPEVLLNSTPPLPNEDLLTLLLTGQLPKGSVGSTTEDAARTVAVFLAQDFFKRWLSDESTDLDESFFDRFDVRAGVDPSRLGVATTLASFRLTDDGDERVLHYLMAERDAYQETNFGYRILFRFE